MRLDSPSPGQSVSTISSGPTCSPSASLRRQERSSPPITRTSTEADIPGSSRARSSTRSPGSTLLEAAFPKKVVPAERPSGDRKGAVFAPETLPLPYGRGSARGFSNRLLGGYYGLQWATALWKMVRPSGDRGVRSRLQSGWWVGSKKRSGWGMRPKILPVESHKPATPATLPLGLAG